MPLISPPVILNNDIPNNDTSLTEICQRYTPFTKLNFNLNSSNKKSENFVNQALRDDDSYIKFNQVDMQKEEKITCTSCDFSEDIYSSEDARNCLLGELYQHTIETRISDNRRFLGSFENDICFNIKPYSRDDLFPSLGNLDHIVLNSEDFSKPDILLKTETISNQHIFSETGTFNQKMPSTREIEATLCVTQINGKIYLQHIDLGKLNTLEESTPPKRSCYEENKAFNNLNERSPTQTQAREPVETDDKQTNFSDTEEQLERNETHNKLERRRRDSLKRCFTNLRDNIPEIEGKEKTSKVEILKKSTEFIKNLKNHQEELEIIRKEQSSLNLSLRAKLGLSPINILTLMNKKNIPYPLKKLHQRS